ncbi:MAG: serine protease [Bacteroidales bacterium]|nr:serine protease [Bacteroidales bacterium]
MKKITLLLSIVLGITLSLELNAQRDDFKAEVSGTGFAICSKDAIVVTAAHVVKNAKRVKVKGINGDLNKSYEAEVVVRDENNDLALLRIVDKGFTGMGNIPYSVSVKPVRLLQEVFILGYPLRTSIGGNLKGYKCNINSTIGDDNQANKFQIDCVVNEGNSGGAVFDANGNIIGVVVEKKSPYSTFNGSLGWCIKSGYLIPLLQEAGTECDGKSTKNFSSMNLEDRVEVYRRFIYNIEVERTSSSSLLDYYSYYDTRNNAPNDNDLYSDYSIDTIDLVSEILHDYKEMDYFGDVERLITDLGYKFYQICFDVVPTNAKKITNYHTKKNRNQDSQIKDVYLYTKTGKISEYYEYGEYYELIVQTTKYSYDANDRLIGIDIYPQYERDRICSMKLTYNSLGQISSVKSYYYGKKNNYYEKYDFSKGGLLLLSYDFIYENKMLKSIKENNELYCNVVIKNNEITFSKTDESSTYSFDSEKRIIKISEEYLTFFDELKTRTTAVKYHGKTNILSELQVIESADYVMIKFDDFQKNIPRVMIAEENGDSVTWSMVPKFDNNGNWIELEIVHDMGSMYDVREIEYHK